MSIESKRRLDLFLKIVELPVEERNSALDLLSSGDILMRERVAMLLHEYEKPDESSENLSDQCFAATVLSKQTDRADQDERSGPQIESDRSDVESTAAAHLASALQSGLEISGRYRLSEKIGEGGMGEVWVAKQTEPVKRRVAIKLIKAGMGSKSVVHRFEQERQALAMMDHPNIAKILDAGITSDLRPFFVMELVKGFPLTQYCDQAKLGIRERLELFVPICQAVQHAHQKGIIHRDLKPSNILVTQIDGHPIPTVIDFGVAKATGGRLTDDTMSTQAGAVIGTLDYMSPEQAGFSGDDVDTRADIYSLGVILYELLTGLKPFDSTRSKQVALHEVIRMIHEEDPSKPSTRILTDAGLQTLAAARQIEPSQLVRLLRGELDWVVMKCLEKQRHHRYETANGLSKDIQKFLSDEPVEARPPSAAYKFEKFWRRNKRSMISIAVVLFALLGGLTAVLAVQAKSNSDLAAKNDALAEEQSKVEQRFDLAQKAIATFHTGISQDLLLKEDQFSELRKKLLSEAAGFYDELQKQLDGQTDLRSRKALAAAYDQLGNLTAKIGSKPEALANHHKALELRQELAATKNADIEARLDVARSLLSIGKILGETGNADASLAAFRQQKEIAQALAEQSPSVPAKKLLAQGYIEIGRQLLDSEKPTESLVAFEAALAIQQKLDVATPGVVELESDLAWSHFNIGRVLVDIRKLPEAIVAYQKANTILQKLADANPTSADLQHRLGNTFHNIGFVQKLSGRGTEAFESYVRARAIYRKLVDSNSAVSEFQRRLAASEANIGTVLRESGRLEEAIEAYQRALIISQKLVDANRNVHAFRTLLARVLDELGWAYSQTNQLTEAIHYFSLEEATREEYDPSLKTSFDARNSLANCLNNKANVLRKSGRLEDARAAAKRALAINDLLVKERSEFKGNNTTSPEGGLAESYLRIGEILRDQGDLNGASSAWRSALAIFEKSTLVTGEETFFRGCCHGGLVGLAGLKDSGVSKEQGDAESILSMEFLRKAVEAGYSSPASYRAESGIDPVRELVDFKTLLTELDAKAKAGTE